MEKRRFPRFLMKMLIYLIFSFLFYVVVIGSFTSYLSDSESLWFAIFQTILFLIIFYFLAKKMIHTIASIVFIDFKSIFIRKKIRKIKEDDNTYSIVRINRDATEENKYMSMRWLDTDLTEEQANIKMNQIKSNKIRKLRLKKLKRLKSL